MVESNVYNRYIVSMSRFPAPDSADPYAFIQEGIDTANRGELVLQGQVMAELEEMIARQRSRVESASKA
jgi:hypothetical protein